jgi:hypothetical protein
MANIFNLHVNRMGSRTKKVRDTFKLHLTEINGTYFVKETYHLLFNSEQRRLGENYNEELYNYQFC